MKYISTILSIIALGLIGIFYFTQKREVADLKARLVTEQKLSGSNGFKVAYFDMDSVEAHYDGFKDAQSQIKAKQNAMDMELSSLDRKNQKTIEGWRQKGNMMTPAEQGAAQQEYQQMQQTFASRKQALEQDLYKSTEDLKTKIRGKIEDFLKDYNKQKSFSYIIEYDAGGFVYVKDTVYNITGELVGGLNAIYKKEK
jgi:outer membrane protein